MTGGGSSQGAIEYLAGTFAGSAQVTSGHPFDTVKVRLQTERGRYSSALDCARVTVRNEGMRGLYRGLVPPLVGGSLETGVNYLLYKRTLAAIQGEESRPGEAVKKHPVWTNFAAGAFAGIFISPVLSPTELIKVPADRRPFSRPSECVRQIVSHEGFKGLFRGLSATWMREIPGNGLVFLTYEALRQQVAPRATSTGGTAALHRDVWGVLRESTSAMLCGGVAGTIFWASVFPIDLAKTRVQTVLPGGDHSLGVLGHLRAVHAASGVRGMYAGLGPTVMRAFWANAFQWMAFELSLWQLQLWLAPVEVAGGG